MNRDDLQKPREAAGSTDRGSGAFFTDWIHLPLGVKWISASSSSCAWQGFQQTTQVHGCNLRQSCTRFPGFHSEDSDIARGHYVHPFSRRFCPTFPGLTLRELGILKPAHHAGGWTSTETSSLASILEHTTAHREMPQERFGVSLRHGDRETKGENAEPGRHRKRVDRNRAGKLNRV
eukprot:2662122-Rhodomonas_salina.3